MKNVNLTLKLAAAFAALHLVVMVVILILFMKVAGHDLIDDLGRLRAYEGSSLAEALEALLQEHGLESAPVRSLMAQASEFHGLRLELSRDTPPDVESRSLHRPWNPHYHDSEILIRGRRCRVYGAPPNVMWIPLFDAGKVSDATKPVAYLVMRGRSHAVAIHEAFRHGLLGLALVSLLGTVGLTIYVTAPLRRMARSMDRVAAGDLDHRLDGRGRDDVAAMGRSFNRMTERIQDMLRRQKELTAAVSHELRSPLARMKMGVELCRDAVDPAPRLEALDQEIDHLDRLVGELLALSRGELAGSAETPEPVVLRPAIENAWRRCAEPSAPPGFRLELDVTPQLRVAMDASSLDKILDNLLGNCLAHAEPGPVRVQAERVASGRLAIRVSDSGPGVDGELLERLFEPFFRADPSRSQDGGHVGLGLMVVERLVAAHGGRVQARHAEPGPGLCLELDLPAAEPGPAAEDLVP